MSGKRCWSCGQRVESNYRFCDQCSAPQETFPVAEGDGFLSHHSRQYLSAVVSGDVDYPKDSLLGKELQESLQSQVDNDVQRAFVDFNLVCGADDKLVFEGVDFSSLLDEEGSREIDELPLSLMGFVNLLRNFADVFPSEVFQRLGESSDG